jgi:nucleoside-triphosphatase THEP1
MNFTKAVRKQAKLRLALTGPSGAGKTYSALLLAEGLGNKIAVIDTERGSASLYSDRFSFDVLDLSPPFSPERFCEAIRAAETAGYDVIVIDSITHEWSGIGGCLEINESLASSKYRGNTWSAWHETTPRHRAFFDKIMSCKAHVIATMRSKTETAQVDDGSRKKVVKLGMKSEQRDGAEFEFTIVFDLIHEGHYAVASKDRTGLFGKMDPAPISADTAKTLNDWLSSATTNDFGTGYKG